MALGDPANLTHPASRQGDAHPESELELFEGEIHKAPTTQGDLIYAILPGVSGTHLEGPCVWQPRVTAAGVFYPRKGTRCLIGRPAGGERSWIVCWEFPGGSPDEAF